jgi:hypothetical protein
MSLSNPSQQPCWEKLALYGLHAKPSLIGFNRHAGRTSRTRAVSPETRERSPRALVKAPRRGFSARGALLPGWVLLPCGVATFAG